MTTPIYSSGDYSQSKLVQKNYVACSGAKIPGISFRNNELLSSNSFFVSINITLHAKAAQATLHI